MSDTTLLEDLEELTGAEEFLEYFDIVYDQKTVHVNRLHILQRFHDYLEKAKAADIDDPQVQREEYKKWLLQAYTDFVNSDAQTEKVFKVFHMNEPQQTFVPADEVFK